MIFFLIIIHAKVFVIDDLNITKRITPSANKDLLKSIKDSVSSNNEEVVVFNTNKDLRISSKEMGLNTPNVIDCTSKGVEIDTPIIEQAQLSKQIEKYERSVHDLKELVGKVGTKEEKILNKENGVHNARGLQMVYGPDYSALLEGTKHKFRDSDTLPTNDLFNNANNDLFVGNEEMKNLSPQHGMPKVDILNNLRSAGSNFQSNGSNSNFQSNGSNSNFQSNGSDSNFQSNGSNSTNEMSMLNTNPMTESEIPNVPKIEMLNSLQGGGSNSRMNEILNSFKKELSNYSRGEAFNSMQNKRSNFNNEQNNIPNESSILNNNMINRSNPLVNNDSLFNNNSQVEKQIEDRLAYTKLKEQNNLIKAIDNRKEYIKMKLQEIKANKEKLSLEMNSYKSKVINILNQIKSIKKAKDTLVNQINTNKNHIQNLNKNSMQIIDRKEQVVSLIRITKNEVQRYRNLLENETNKLEMLEKQYEVYEETLKKYSDDIDTESHKLNRTSTELSKNGIDLENLEDLYREYSQKNQQIEEELRRYEKIVVCLDSEEKKVMRNQLSGFVV